MLRIVEKDLLEWKNSTSFKPLLLMGARQVGKTWLMKNLGESHFQNYIYVNFEKEPSYQKLFETSLDPKKIVETLSLLHNQKIEEGQTLIIFDEIQEASHALTSLKYFAEDFPNIHIIAAGSLLGVTLDNGSFPVGKVEFLKIYPLNFQEFLWATNQAALWEFIKNKDYEVIHSFKEQYIRALRNYYIVGGMPEAVGTFIKKEGSYTEVKRIQANILNAYMQDFAKHAPAPLIPKIIAVWNGLASQLAKENKKFVYGALKSGARAREYENAIDWLINYGLVHKIYAVNKLAFPLQAYRDFKNFKLYASDIGLLAHMSQLNPHVILEDADFFEEFKGALTEQYVMQELNAFKLENISYWSNENGNAELDFIFEQHGVFYPLEVKAAENLQAKSLKIFHQKNKDVFCYRTSLSNYRKESWMTNIPLYALGSIWSN
jgi:predicted AAA+ superfamily ATPase